jgi:hypothetical protein
VIRELLRSQRDEITSPPPNLNMFLPFDFLLFIVALLLSLSRIADPVCFGLDTDLTFRTDRMRIRLRQVIFSKPTGNGQIFTRCFSKGYFFHCYLLTFLSSFDVLPFSLLLNLLPEMATTIKDKCRINAKLSPERAAGVVNVLAIKRELGRLGGDHIRVLDQSLKLIECSHCSSLLLIRIRNLPPPTDLDPDPALILNSY